MLQTDLDLVRGRFGAAQEEGGVLSDRKVALEKVGCLLRRIFHYVAINLEIFCYVAILGTGISGISAEVSEAEIRSGDRGCPGGSGKAEQRGR